jgi:polyferredoxin
MLLTGLFVLGFWYNMPLTLSKVSSLLLGYWPAWQSNLYWYFLIGGILLIATVDGKNSYCAWFCPFGAAQECMGAIGGARHTVARRVGRSLTWVQRALAWAALALAFLFRNPGMSSYEIFGTLFSFTGSAVLFLVLAVVLLLSLFVKRPWCNFLCPLNPVYDLVHLLRAWIIRTWKSRRAPVSALST